MVGDHPQHRLLGRTLPFAAVLVLLSCDSGIARPEMTVCGPSAEATAVPVVLDPDAFTFGFIGQQVRLEPSIGAGSDGSAFELTWEVADPSVVSVDTTGTLQARGAGASVVRVQAATCNQVGSAEALVQVEQIPETVEFVPAELSLGVGEQKAPELVVLDAAGYPIPGPSLSWDTSDPAVIGVDQDGTVAGRSTGTAEIVVGAGPVQAQAKNGCRRRRCARLPVRVGPRAVQSLSLTPTSLRLTVGTSASLEAVARDVDGKTVGAEVEWSTSDASVMVVSGDGRVTARGVGTASVEAKVGKVKASAEVTVTSVPVASVQVQPGTFSLTVGGTRQLRATPRDANGNALERTVTWRSSNAEVATVASDGTVTARGTGSATLTASAGSASGRASLTVSVVPVASISVAPASLSLTVGQSNTVRATLRDANGNTLDRPVSWSTTDARVATVTSNGTVTARAVGSTAIRATSEGRTATVQVSVASVPVASVEVQPTTFALTVGGTRQLRATPRDANGNALERTVTWRSSNAEVATVAGDGTVTARGTGSATLTASSGSASGRASLTVSVAPVASISVAPTSLSLTVGQSNTVRATPRDADGNALDRSVTWSSADAAIASVSSNGTVTARAVGSTTIRATSGGRSATVRVSVASVPVASIQVQPGTFSLNVGDTRQLRATARDAGGNVLDRTVEWRSSNAGVATIASNGTVTARAAGSATLTASAGSVSGRASLTVSVVPVASVSVNPASLSLTVGGTQQVRATPRDADGNALDRSVTWSSANTSVATVSSNGTVTARAVGTATIRATSGGRSATVSVTVAAVPVASVSVNPASLSLTVGGTQQVRATPRDADGNALDRSVTWSSANTSVATVSSNGTVTARAAGTATVRATSGGRSATVSVTVTAVPVASVSVNPTTLSLAVGGTQQVRATPRDADGNALDRSVTWSSGNTSVATVSSNGTVTARAAGSATVRATSGGRSATVSVTVTAVPVASVSVNPATLSLTVGGTQQVRATPRDADGNALNRSVTWSSGNTSVATVSSNGTVTARAAGSARITATSEGKTGTAQVTVTVEPVARVDVSPSSVGLEVGETTQLDATPRDASGRALNRSVSWSSSNTSVATVSSNGTVTARGAGSATIRATSESVTGSAQVSVTQPAQGGGTLTWRPPSGWGSYTTRTLPASGGVVTLDDNTDYRLLNPTSNGGVITGTLTIKGGRNVVWIGGEVRIDTYRQESESVQSGVRVYSSDRTRVQGRIVHLEGLLIHGQHLADGLVINAPEAVVQAQNIHARPNRPETSGIHADVIQAWGGVRELRVDHLTGYTSYQGFMLKADYNGPSGPMDFRNVNLSDNGSNTSRYLVWWEPNKNTTIDLQNVWVRLSSSKVLGKAVWPDRDASNSSLRPTVTSDGTSTYAEWRNTSQATGRVREGRPPGGDFVDRSQVGIGYRSPGYR